MDNPPITFGAFETLFGESTGYLSLLNLGDGAGAVRQLAEAIHAAGDRVEDTIERMLAQANWRPQLVAAAALVVAPGKSRCIPALWAALDRSCWTSPQLAVAAFRIDPAFLQNARSRLERRCPIGTANLPAMSALQRHSTLGPGSAAHHSTKLGSALTALCGLDENARSWLPSLLGDPEFKRWIDSDRDDGGRIAVGWLEKLETLAAQLQH